MSSAPTSFSILAGALRADSDSNRWSAPLDAASLDSLVIAALALGLAPLLHYRLAQLGIPLPERATAKLGAARKLAAAQQLLLTAQLEQVLAPLAAHGIKPVLLKGAHLTACVYPEPGLRQMNDLDLLLCPEEMPVVESVLRQLGYAARHKSPDQGAGVVKHTVTFHPARPKDAFPNPYLAAGAARTIEPHTSLQESWYGLRVDISPGMRERSEPLAVGSQVALGLCPADLVLHLSTHLVFHLIMGYPSMVQLVDLMMVTSRIGARIDWRAVQSRAVAAGAAPYVYTGLRLASEILAAPIPTQTLAELADACPTGLRQRAGRMGLADIVSRTQRPPVTTISQRILRGLADRALAAEWAVRPGDRWRVWKSILDVSRTDTGQLLQERLRAAGRPRLFHG